MSYPTIRHSELYNFQDYETEQLPLAPADLSELNATKFCTVVRIGAFLYLRYVKRGSTP